MAEGRNKAEWSRCSVMLAMIHNTAFGREKKDMVTAQKFNPYEQAKPAAAARGSVQDLRALVPRKR